MSQREAGRTSAVSQHVGPGQSKEYAVKQPLASMIPQTYVQVSALIRAPGKSSLTKVHQVAVCRSSVNGDA